MNFKQISHPNCRAIARLYSDPLYRNSFFMAFSSIFNASCGFFFWMIAARFYTLEEVGLATALVSSLGLVLLFSKLGFDFSIIRFFSSENTDKAGVFGTSLVVTTAATLLVGMAYIMLTEFFTPNLLFLKEYGYALTFILVGALNSMATMTGLAFVADRKADLFLFQHIFMALRIPLLIPMAFLGIFGILVSMGVAFLVALFFALIVIRRNFSIRLDVDMDFFWKSTRFSSWNYASNILFMAPNLILPIMVLNTLGEAEAAKYYIASAIGNIVLIIPGSLGTSLFVEGSHGMGLKKSVLRAASASFALLIPTVLVIWLIGDKLLELVGAKYLEGFDLLKLLSLSSFLVTLYSMFIPIQNVRMRLESVIELNAIRCALLIGLSFFLMKQYGILGVGYGWMITYGLLTIKIGWVIWRQKWI